MNTEHDPFVATPAKLITRSGNLDIAVSSIPSKCKACNATIYWAETQAGKLMPVRKWENEGEYISHFADCPAAKKFRQ